jgi:hypothetical protein
MRNRPKHEIRPDKEYGRLKGSEFSDLLRAFRQSRLDKAELEREAGRTGSKLAKLLEDGGYYWCLFYELPFTHHLALTCFVLGLNNVLSESGKSNNPTRAFMDLMRSKEVNENNPLESMDSEGRALVINLLIGMSYSLEAIGYFSMSINEMLARAAAGERRFLLQAVSIDKTIVGTPTATTAIAQAQLARDKGFISGLFKRTAGPHVARRTYVDLRFMRQIFEEAGALVATGPEELLDLVQRELNLYTQKRGDPVKGLAERFRMWAPESTTRK